MKRLPLLIAALLFIIIGICLLPIFVILWLLGGNNPLSNYIDFAQIVCCGE